MVDFLSGTSLVWSIKKWWSQQGKILRSSSESAKFLNETSVNVRNILFCLDNTIHVCSIYYINIYVCINGLPEVVASGHHTTPTGSLTSNAILHLLIYLVPFRRIVLFNFVLGCTATGRLLRGPAEMVGVGPADLPDVGNRQP